MRGAAGLLLALLLARAAAAAPDAGLQGHVWADTDFFGNTVAVAGAAIQAYPTSGGAMLSATSQADGSYLLNGLDAAYTYDLTVEAPALARCQAKGLTLAAGTASPWDLVMNHGSSLTGTVTTGGGAPIGLAYIQASRNNINNTGSYIAETWTAADGSYRLDHLPLGVYIVVAKKAGYANGAASAVTLAAAPVMVYPNLGNGVFGAPVALPLLDPVRAALWVAGTGSYPDIVVRNSGVPDRWWKNDGAGHFSLQPTPPAPGSLPSDLLGDYAFLDASPWQELVLGNPSEQVMLYSDVCTQYHNYYGYANCPYPYPFVPFGKPGFLVPYWVSWRFDYTVSVRFGDAEQDGKPDLLVGNFSRLDPRQDFVLADGGTLQGVIRDGVTGGPPRVVCSLQAANGGSTLMSGSSGSDGSYRFNHLDPAAYTLDVSAPGYLPYTQSGLAVLQGQATVRDVTLVPAAALAGTVVDDAGAPLVGVLLSAGPLNLTVASAADGSFYFGPLGGGDYSLQASAAGRPGLQQALTVSAPGTVPLWLTMTAQTAMLDGRVLAEGDGTPIAGARVVAGQLGGTGYGSAYTGADGRFSLALVPGGYSLNVSAAGFMAGDTVALLTGQSPVLLRLRRRGGYPDLSRIRAYPNPCRVSKAVRGTLKFTGLPAMSTLTLFDASGAQVAVLPPGFALSGSVNDGDSGQAEWSCRSDRGGAVASGVYFWRVVDQEGREARGKVAIIR